MKRPAHALTTAHLCAAYPFLTHTTERPGGVYLGRQVLGGSFGHDPFDLYASGQITNPNMVVLGEIGRGKSSLVKSYLWRQLGRGTRAWVVDPKGEYAPLAEACGTRPLRLGGGGTLRINPFDAASIHDASGLLLALAESTLGRPLNPQEVAAAEIGLHDSTRGSGASLQKVVDAMLTPSREAAAELRTSRPALKEDGREPALALRRLLGGELGGLLDGQVGVGATFSQQLVVVDLSALHGSPLLGALMTCVLTWLRSHLNPGSPPAIVVLDEAWTLLGDVGLARWLRANWKLSRAKGVSNVAVLHRISDLDGAGPRGSEQVQIARGLLSDSETRIIFAQSPGEIESSREALALSDAEARLLSRLGRGMALWKVGSSSFLVQHRLSVGELAFVDTDLAMRR